MERPEIDQGLLIKEWVKYSDWQDEQIKELTSQQTKDIESLVEYEQQIKELEIENQIMVDDLKTQHNEIKELDEKLEWCKTDSATLIKKYNSRGEQIKELEEERKKLVFMVENGLGYEDLKDDN